MVDNLSIPDRWLRKTYNGGRMKRMMAALGLMLMLAGMEGCGQALFPAEAPRTQYDRYASLRGQSRQATQRNVLGQEEKALRERLKPLGQP